MKHVTKDKVILIIFVHIIIISIIAMFIMYLFDEKATLIKKYDERILHYIQKLEQSEKDNKVKIAIIQNKVKKLNTFIRQIYPSYDYAEKFNNIIDNLEESVFNEKLEDLPDTLLQIYIQQYLLKAHGLDRYELKYPELGWPVDPKNSLVPNFGEMGSYREYSQYNYMHEGVDIVSITNETIYAPYDSYVDRIYDWEGGKTIVLKYFNTKRNHWCKDEFLHCDIILVEKGDKILKGEKIAQLGNTGIFSKGKHLHWSHSIFNGKKWIHTNVFMNSTWNQRVVNIVNKRW
jgi:murein DD-endopeptidase MepM/ murein hydrolase activator NlpD